MESPSLEAVCVRLNHLERENRILKRAGVVLSFAFIAWVVLGSGFVKPAGQVVAERFILKDSSGQVRAHLSTKSDGSPELALFGQKGSRVVSLNASADDTGSLDYFDKGDVRVSLSSTPGGSAVLNFMDRNGKSASGMYMWPDSSTGVGFRSGDRSVYMKVAADGSSRLSFFDKDGKEIDGIGDPASVAGTGAAAGIPGRSQLSAGGGTPDSLGSRSRTLLVP